VSTFSAYDLWRNMWGSKCKISKSLIAFPFLSAIFSLKNPEETKKNEE